VKIFIHKINGKIKIEFIKHDNSCRGRRFNEALKLIVDKTK
jgi:hypothetical protein